MAETDDDYMRRMIGTTHEYTLMILRAGPGRREPGAEQIVWEHGRRNFALRAEGSWRSCVPWPTAATSQVSGSSRRVRRHGKLMDEDPGVRAGVFVYEVHACRSFPGDALP